MSDEFKFKSENLFGHVDYYFENPIESIDVENHRTIDLGFIPASFYSLPNGNLVIASNGPPDLKIYDKEFKLIKTFDKINNKTFRPQYLTSNVKNSIYITDRLNNSN